MIAQLASLAAQFVVALHAAFVAFALFGGLLVLKSRRIWPLHVAALVWGATVEFTGWICPLTPLENRLHALAAEQGYAEGFVEHYVVPLLYPGDLTRTVQLCLGTALVAVNAVIYGTLYVRWRRTAAARNGGGRRGRH